MKKSLIVLQDGYKECGAASLLSIIRYYHGNIPITRLTELTQTTTDGTSFYNLKLAAEELGLEAIGYKTDKITNLKEINKPFICQLINNNYEHFTVVYEVKKAKIIMMDPAKGECVLTEEEFMKKWTGYIMIFSPKKKLNNYKDEKYLNKIIVETLKKNKRILLDITLLSIVFMLVSLIYTKYLEIALEYIIGTTVNNLVAITFVFAILLLIKCITNFFRNELLIYLNQKMDCSILLNTFKKILLLPYNYYKNKTTGEIVSRINDLIYVKNILNKIILTVCLDSIILICFSIILFINYSKLFPLLVIIILIYIIVFYLFKRTLKNYTEKNQINSAKLNSYLIETINGFETIKNMNLESITNKKLEKTYINILNHYFEYENIANLELLIKEIVSMIGLLLLEFLGLTLVMKNKMTFGNLLTFTFLTNYVLDPIRNILDLNKEYFYAENAINRANHLFEVESEDLSKKTHFKLKGDIIFNHLTYGYTIDHNILKDITLKINAGEKVMILGNSGSGKSTILKLLLKYYFPNRDSIYLDKIDLNDFSISDIREQIACVSQNELIFNDTIKNNITVNRNITESDFQEMVQLTYVNEIVKNLFLGYDTKLEENGQNISGGQKQRIVLARMLLKPSKIVLIDEGLNAIDINLERKILKNIFSKYKEKTFIIVSHRIENIDLFHRVIELDSGFMKQNIHKEKGQNYD